MLWTVTRSEDEARARMARTLAFQQTHEAYTVYLKSTGRAIGFAGMLRLEDGETWEDTGVALGPAWVRRGYGTQIVRALCARARALGGRTMVLSARAQNAASRGLIESLGFRQFRIEDRIDDRDGSPFRLVFYRSSLEEAEASEPGEKKPRCVVVGGAEIRNYARVRAYLRAEDFVIYCDSGLKHRVGLGAAADLILGDFDSWENPHAETETIVLPVVKDDTDTAFAVKEALRRGFSDFLLVGVIGGRLDHTLGNLQLLYRLDGLGKTALALDDQSEITVVSRRPALVGPEFPYFSLLNLTGEAREVCIEGAKYELSGAEIPCDDPYAVSNEPLPGQTARITVGTGRLLLIRDF